MTRRAAAWAFALALMFSARPIQAQRVAVEALVDGELYRTDDSSRLLARNHGEPAHTLRAQLWGVLEPAAGIQLRILGRAENSGGLSPVYALDQLSLRFARSRAFTLELGKLLLPVGAFGARRFSNVNPLIGIPDVYASEYPLGVEVSGAVGAMDYKAAIVSLPAVNAEYTTEPSARARPVVGLGWSAGPAFRLGATYTAGSYLSDASQPAVPKGASWDQFGQRVFALDAHWSTGYLDTHAEAIWSTYEVPTISGVIGGTGWYGESRYTLSPRWFVAGRYEFYNYPFVMPLTIPIPSQAPRYLWIGRAVTQMNGEAGVGYRATESLLFKASARKDHWPVHETPDGTRFPDGYALALQLSWHASISEMLMRP